MPILRPILRPETSPIPRAMGDGQGGSLALAAPTFQAAGTGTASASAITPAWPAHQAGDIALLIVEAARTDTVALTSANGFVEIPVSPLNNGVGTTASNLAVFWCRATSNAMSDPTLGAVTDHQAGVILTYRGCRASGNPWDVIATSVVDATTTTPSAPSVTTTVPNACIVSIISRGVSTAIGQFSAWGNSATERFDAGTALGNGGGVGVADYTAPSAGLTPATGATLNNTSMYCAMTIALRG